MIGPRLLILLGVLFLAGACGVPASSGPPVIESVTMAPTASTMFSSSPVPAASPTSLASTASIASPSPTASAPPHPLSLKQAAAAFVAVHDRYWRNADRLTQTYNPSGVCAWSSPPPCTAANLDAAKSYWTEKRDALRRYRDGLKQIAFPVVAAPASATVLSAINDAIGAVGAAVNAATIEEFNRLTLLARASLDADFRVPEQELMDALGLPVGP